MVWQNYASSLKLFSASFLSLGLTRSAPSRLFCLLLISATQENLEYTERKQTIMKLHDPRIWALRKWVEFDTNDTGQSQETVTGSHLAETSLRDFSTNNFVSLELLLLSRLTLARTKRHGYNWQIPFILPTSWM